MSLSGNELKEHNDKIVKCITELKVQRNELNYLIEKQQEEKIKLQTEIERITYKLSLISKSLSQRVATRTNYDRTIQQAEENYNRLVETSEKLLQSVEKDVGQLEQMMDKKVGTETNNSNKQSDNSSSKFSVNTNELVIKTEQYESGQASLNRCTLDQ